MKEIILLECVYGYELKLEDGLIIYTHVGDTLPDLEKVQPLFQAISEKRSQTVEYLIVRDQPVDVAGHIWEAAAKAQNNAFRAEQQFNHQLAQKEWQRSARLFAAAAKMSGATEPHIPWPVWVAGIDELDSSLSG